MDRYETNLDHLLKVAIKNHTNGAVNELAHFQKDLGYDFCRNESEKNPFISGPLKRTDCSPITPR